MLNFLQFLNEADYTYTTDQNKTDEHVKQYVKDVIDKPQVELEKNGVTIAGELNSKFNRYIQLTDKGIQITSDITKQLTSIASDLLSKMVDSKVVQIRSTDSDNDSVPQGDKTNYILTIKFECSGSSFTGIVEITISWLGNVDDELKSSDKCDITIKGNWVVD